MFEALVFGYYEEGIAVKSTRRIFEHFITTNSVVMVVSAVGPWDLVAYRLQGDVRIIPAMRLLKLLNSRHINRYIGTLGWVSFPARG